MMQRALERQQKGEARVIPILLRQVYYADAPFTTLTMLPSNGTAIASHADPNSALAEVARSIHTIVKEVSALPASSLPATFISSQQLPTALFEEERDEAPSPVLDYKGHKGFVLTVSWSHDGRFIASAGSDGTVHVWNAANGLPILIYHRHIDELLPGLPLKIPVYIHAVSWSPTTRQIASAGTKETIHIWNAFTGTIDVVYSHQARVLSSIHSLAWSPNGSFLASICSMERFIVFKALRIWDTKTHQLIQEFSLQAKSVNEHLSATSALAWSPDGQYIATASGGENLSIWHATQGTLVDQWRLGHDMTLVVAWSPNDKQRLATAGGDHMVRIWQVGKNRRLLSTCAGHSGNIRAIAWSPDGQYLSSTSHDKTIRIWDPETGTCLHTFRHHTGWVNSVSWSPQGKRLASGSQDGTVRVQLLETSVF